MAPSKKKEKAKPGEASLRVTRSMSRSLVRETRSSGSPAKKLVSLGPPTRKKKPAKAARKAGKKKEEEEKVEEEKTSEGVEEGADAVESNNAEKDAVVASKKIVIEHCKQCNSFKTRANQVKKGLEEGVPGITVELNPEKPRRGCFEIRQDGDEIFISLLNMKRPFTAMKNLDMDEVIADIIKKIK